MIGDAFAARAVSTKPFKSRWLPVDLACMRDGTELQVRTKLIRSEESAAVCVSEVVSYNVLSALGLVMADCHAVSVEEDFAAELTRQFGFDPPVLPGRHWGTTFLGNSSQEVEFHESMVGELRRKEDVFTLFLGDLILGNPDRKTQGNVLLAGAEDGMDIIPIDQSDCFNHPSTLRDAARLQSFEGTRIAAWLPGTEVALLGLDASFPRSEVARVQAMEDDLVEMAASAPTEWYRISGVDPDWMRSFLRARIRNLAQLADLPHWENVRLAIGGGLDLRI